MKKTISIAAGALGLSGCVTTNVPPGPPVTLEELIRQIKSDVGQYNAYAEAHAGDAPLNTACGGKVDLTVKSVTVTVTTTTKTSEGGTAGAVVTPSPIVKLTANGGIGRVDQSSQVLTFTLVPLPPRMNEQLHALQDSGPPSQLLPVLMNLRQSLLAASNTTPCLTFPKEKQDNSIAFGFQATRSTTAGFGVNLWIFSIGATRSTEDVAANTIKIAFEGSGQFMQNN